MSYRKLQKGVPVEHYADNALFTLIKKSSQLIDNGVMWLNADGHLLGFNDKLIAELGYETGEYEPKTIFEVNPTTSFLSWKKLWEKALKDKSFSVKTEQLTADNTIYPVNMRGTLLDIDGNNICMLVVENLVTSNRYKELLDITSDIVNIGSWEMDLIQDEIIFSNQMYQILEIPKGQILNKSYLLNKLESVIQKVELNDVIKGLQELIKSGDEMERQISIKSGERYIAYRVSVRSQSYEGQSIKLFGTVQNMAKINTQLSTLHFTQYVMDNATEGIFWIDENDCFIYVNKQACDTLGYTKEELIGQHATLISPEYIANMKILNKEMDFQDTGAVKSLHKKKDGTVFPISIVSSRIEFEGRSYHCGFVRDLSQIKEREEIIAIIEQSLDQSPDMFCSLRLDRSFKYYNDAFLKASGYTREELNKMDILDILKGGDEESFEMGIAALKKGKTYRDIPRTIQAKDGSTIPVEMAVDIVNVEGEYYTTNLFRDITYRLAKEKERDMHLAKIEELQKLTAEENIELRAVIEEEFNFGNIISKDPNYKKVLQQVYQVAETPATVLILGETGTGKELLARAIYQLSDRAEMPMVKVNCGALPENLIESELFGHEKGSFTGAHQQKIGKFERANNGTIFLDEIGELPLDLQTKLLRVLQEGEIERVGGTTLINLDVRIIAATNRNLEQRVAEGKFRADLYYRLNVFPIRNLPLRERPEDISVLADHFVKKYSAKLGKKITKISSRSLNNLMAYSFQGNVRELENIIERAVILCKDTVLTIDGQLLRTEKTIGSKRFLSLEDAQKEHIIKALRRTKGKVSGDKGAAVLLVMNDRTLTSRIRKLGITKKDYT